MCVHMHDDTQITLPKKTKITINPTPQQAAYQTTGRERLAAAEQASAAQERAGVVSNGLVTETIYSLRKGKIK